MTFNSNSRVPLELYPLIIEHIDNKNDLLSMLVTSKAISYDVEHKIYHSVHFDHQNDKSHILFLESVLDAKRSHRSGFIRRYCYTTVLCPNPDLPGLIKRALLTFTNLKQLRFIVSDEEILASALPLDNPPFQLELFQWAGYGHIARHDIGVLHFLTSQHSLKTLCIINGGSELPRVSSLQNLRNLNNVVGHVAAILPLLPRSVPIRRIDGKIGVGPDFNHFPLLTGLRVLSFYSTDLRPPLSVIAQRFGTVEVLRLHSLQHGELPDLYQLPLRILVLDKLETVANCTDEIFRNMKFLQHIFVSTDSTGRRTCQYQRWDRNAETAMLVSGDVVETNWWCQL